MATTINAGRVRFVSRGTYNNSTQYYLFDLVDYNGSSYIAKENSLGNLPTNTQYWQLIAEKGNTGNTGSTGNPGPVGPTGNGIASIRKTGTSGLVDTYTITYTNGNTTTFTVTNGEDGEVTETELNVLRQKVANQQKVIDQLPQVTGQGTSITLENTIEAQFTKFDVEGNSVQDGTPSPDNEVPILSAGDNGSINEKIKNADGTEEQDYSIPVQQPMRSIGNVRDGFVKKDGNWFERHYIGEVVLNGSEDKWFIVKRTNGNVFQNATIIQTPDGRYKFIGAISNYFKGELGQKVFEGTELNTIGTAENNYLRFYTSNESIEDFRAYLAEQYSNGTPLYVNYILANPIYLPCTETQIQQLENLPSTYKDFTIINSEDETKAYLEVSGIYDLNNNLINN